MSEVNGGGPFGSGLNPNLHLTLNLFSKARRFDPVWEIKITTKIKRLFENSKKPNKSPVFAVLFWPFAPVNWGCDTLMT